MDKNIGKKLDGRYEITELVGVGGTADVYKATDIMEDKIVAVKILKNEFSRNEDFIRRFRNESKAIAVLSHPNIVKIYDVGFSDKIQFIVMEYIDGITLKEFMEQQGTLKWKDSIHFIVQVLRALQHAHDRGIVHRDIKPQNVMLFPDGTIRVMDFGIARFAREEGKTISDKAIGSVHYISPEQARGDVTDEKSDIYSVGILLYEMLTGEKPFDADNPVAIALMHMQNEAKNPKMINDAIPEGLDEIVVRATQKEPSKRYQSASAMIKDIEEFKKNPSIVFEYKYLTEKTQYFNSATVVNTYSNIEKSTKKPQNKKPAQTQKPSYQPQKNKGKRESEVMVKKNRSRDYHDYEEERVSKSSYFVVILTAVAAVILIIVLAFISLSIIDKLMGEDSQISKMPNLMGLKYTEVKSYYSGSFDVVVVEQEYSSEYPEGAIIDQSTSPDRDYLVGKAVVEVVVSKGPRIVTVPNVYELDSSSAQVILDDNTGFNVIIKSQFHETIDKDMVIMTDPAHYEDAEYGSTVYLYVSRGPEIQEIVVPDLKGQNLATAQELIKGKLTPQIMRVDSDKPKDEIIDQSLSATLQNGQPNIVPLGTTVILTVSNGVAIPVKSSISFSVPSSVQSGAATFNCYINGQLVGTSSVDNIAFTSIVTVEVSGNGVSTVLLEVVNDDNFDSAFIGEYSVDFTQNIVTENLFDVAALNTVFSSGYNPYPDFGDDSVITLPDDPAPDLNDFPSFDEDDYWNNIINGR